MGGKKKYIEMFGSFTEPFKCFRKCFLLSKFHSNAFSCSLWRQHCCRVSHTSHRPCLRRWRNHGDQLPNHGHPAEWAACRWGIGSFVCFYLLMRDLSDLLMIIVIWSCVISTFGSRVTSPVVVLRRLEYFTEYSSVNPSLRLVWSLYY